MMSRVGSNMSSRLSARQIRRGMNASIMATVVWVVFGTVVYGSPVFSALMVALDFTEKQFGYMLALCMGAQAMQFVGVYLQQRFFHRKRFWFVCVVAHYAFFGLMIALVAFWAKLPAAWMVPMFMLFYFFSASFASAQTPSSIAWQADVVPSTESTAYWSRKNGLSSLASIVAGILMGLFVDHLGREQTSTFVYAGVIGLAGSVLSIWFQSRMRDPSPQPPPNLPPIFSIIGELWRERQIRFIVYFYGFQTFINGAFVAFVGRYFLRDMGCTVLQFQLMCAVGGLGAFFGSYLYRTIGAKFGRKPILVICTVGKIIEFGLWTLLVPYSWGLDKFVRSVAGGFGMSLDSVAPGALWGVVVLGAAGFINVGLMSAQFSLITSMSNRKLQGFSVAFCLTMVSLGGMVTSYFSGDILKFCNGLGWFAQYHITGYNLLAAFTGIGFALSLLFLIRFRESGATSTRTVVRMLFSDNPFRSVYHAHSFLRPMSEKSRVELVRRAAGGIVANDLVRNLYNPSGRVREEVLLNLLATEPPLAQGIEEELIKLLDAPELGMQSMVARILGRQKSIAAVPALIELFESPDISVAQAAMFSAGDIGDASAVAPLIDALNDESRAVLWATAVEALSKIGDYQYTRLIFKVMKRQSHIVHYQQCLIALCRTMTDDKNLPISFFDMEDKSPGTAITRLYTYIVRHPALRMHGIRLASRDEFLAACDAENFAACVEMILPAELEIHGVGRRGEISIADFLDDRFRRHSERRYSSLPDNAFALTNFWLQFKLWEELKYDKDERDHLVLLAFLFCVKLLLDVKYRG